MIKKHFLDQKKFLVQEDFLSKISLNLNMFDNEGYNPQDKYYLKKIHFESCLVLKRNLENYLKSIVYIEWVTAEIAFVVVG